MLLRGTGRGGLTACRTPRQASRALLPLTITTLPRGRACYPHFTKKETEAQGPTVGVNHCLRYTVGICVLIENIYPAPTACQSLNWVLGKLINQTGLDPAHMIFLEHKSDPFKILQSPPHCSQDPVYIPYQGTWVCRSPSSFPSAPHTTPPLCPALPPSLPPLCSSLGVVGPTHPVTHHSPSSQPHLPHLLFQFLCLVNFYLSFEVPSPVTSPRKPSFLNLQHSDELPGHLSCNTLALY